MDVLELISRHGALMLGALCFVEAVGLPLPAALALVSAGALADRGSLALWPTFAAALAGLLAGDVLLYLIGRFTGWYFLGLLCRMSMNPESCIYNAAHAFYRRGRSVLLFTKFVPGINTMSAPLAGSLNMPPLQFLLFDAAGAIIYAGAYFTLGYLFSGVLGEVAQRMAEAGSLVKVLLVAALVAYLAYRVRLARRLRAEFVDIPRVEPRELAQLMEECADGLLVLDVRSHGYYGSNAVRIKGSSRLEPNRLSEALHELPEAKKIYLYCT
ncbi:MAG: VTT domain-containing protein [Bryobacteraceae bacterium]